MKVYLGWSGESSKQIAHGLRQWIPNVLQAVDPWMSDVDLDAGVTWPTELFTELEKSDFGVICLTTQNLVSPWLLFEAGALSKKVGRAKVVPYLYKIEPSVLRSPLSLFQCAIADIKGTYKLLASLNKYLGDAGISSTQLETAYRKWHPDWQKVLEKVPSEAKESPEPRPNQEEIIEEILLTVRELSRKTETFQQPIYTPEGKYTFMGNPPTISTSKSAWLAGDEEPMGDTGELFPGELPKIHPEEDDDSIAIPEWLKGMADNQDKK